MGSYFGIFLPLAWLFFCFSRLLLLQGVFARAKKNLLEAGVLPKFLLAVLLRLSDKEIVELAFGFSPKIYQKWRKEKKERFEVLFFLYFQNSRDLS